MDALIMTIIENIMIILVTLAAGFIVAFIRKRIGTEGMQKVVLELALKQELAELAVKFAEQVYRDFKGDEKYTMAALWLADSAGGLGLKISESEIKGLIEAALRTCKDEFGEQWAKAIKEP